MLRRLERLARTGELGLRKVAAERAKSYILTVFQLTQWLMTLAIYLATAKPNGFILMGITSAGLCSVYFFWKFMKFDFKVGMAAEYGKTWEINPAYQKLLQEIAEIRKSVKKLEYPLITAERHDDY